MAAAAVDRVPTVEETYDDIGPAYQDAFAGLTTQLASIEWLLNELKDKTPAKCLDIGCGTGNPVCSSLSAGGHDALGIDISGAMIEHATKTVPKATFRKISIFDYQTDAASFDAITVYFSLLAGITRDQIRKIINNISEWLRPGGLFVFGTVPIAADNVEMKWMGRPVVVSSLDAEEAIGYIRDVGFEVVQHATSTFTPKAVEAGLCSKEDVWEEPHLFVYARKPR